MAHIPCPENHSRQLKPPPAIDEVERCAAPRWACWRRKSPAAQSRLCRWRLRRRRSRGFSKPLPFAEGEPAPSLVIVFDSGRSGASVFLRDAV